MLQLTSLKCAELCLQTIQQAGLPTERRENGQHGSDRFKLVQSLASCGVHCIACAQCEAFGGCLPETVRTCRDACAASLIVLKEFMVGEDAHNELFNACEAALRACSAECDVAK